MDLYFLVTITFPVSGDNNSKTTDKRMFVMSVQRHKSQNSASNSDKLGPAGPSYLANTESLGIVPS